MLGVLDPEVAKAAADGVAAAHKTVKVLGKRCAASACLRRRLLL